MGTPVLEIPKPEIKPFLTSDQAKAKIDEEKKEVADEKVRADAEAAKMKALEKVGEKKDASAEVPIAKCPSELKKEKDDAEKAEADKIAKETAEKLEKEQAVK